MDEGDGSAQVCMHFGGAGLRTGATLAVYNGSALSKFSEYIHELLKPLPWCVCVLVCVWQGGEGRRILIRNCMTLSRQLLTKQQHFALSSA